MAARSVLAEGFPPRSVRARTLAEGFPPRSVRARTLAEGFPPWSIRARTLAGGFPAGRAQPGREAPVRRSTARSASWTVSLTLSVPLTM